MNLKNSFDFKSIKFKLWVYFISFAVILLILIWSLQIFFLNTYYEAMKIQETTKIANQIIDSYNDKDSDINDFTEIIRNVYYSNDIYIKIETGDGSILIASDYSGQAFMYGNQVRELREKLENSTLTKVKTVISSGRRGFKTLAYACYLRQVNNPDASKEENEANSYILYIFSPLYPVESTISILRTQLVYITLIAALLSLALALYLASKISKPIKDITYSAAEMGKGNYSVAFKGGHYTEITELADTLTDASRELEKTDMYQKDLIANVSHDLKTPLTMIKSYAEMIRDLSGDDPKKRGAHLHVIIDEADRLNILVNDMLNMSKMQSKKIVLEQNFFDISNAVKSLLTSYEILAEQEGYIFNLNHPGPLFVYGDEAKLKQVLTNLINNAVKYCGVDKMIKININKIGKKVRCEIIDHGPGIAPDEINHVWERYYKSSTHHVRPTEGSGLGLSIVKEILTLHKAEYGVTSKVGEGSTFWFELPLAKQSSDIATKKS